MCKALLPLLQSPTLHSKTLAQMWSTYHDHCFFFFFLVLLTGASHKLHDCGSQCV